MRIRKTSHNKPLIPPVHKVVKSSGVDNKKKKQEFLKKKKKRRDDGTGSIFDEQA